MVVKSPVVQVLVGDGAGDVDDAIDERLGEAVYTVRNSISGNLKGVSYGFPLLPRRLTRLPERTP